LSEVGTYEEIHTAEWAETEDLARQRLLAQLLNACLKEKLFPLKTAFPTAYIP